MDKREIKAKKQLLSTLDILEKAESKAFINQNRRLEKQIKICEERIITALSENITGLSLATFMLYVNFEMISLVAQL